jgi:hypothetical protein
MQRMRNGALALVVVVGAMLAVAPAATTAPPADISIQLFVTTFCCPEIGTWQAAGAVSDSGTYVRTGGRTTGSVPDCFCWFTHPGAFEEEFLLVGSRGTLTVKAEQLATPTGDMAPARHGVWLVVSGTGAYERASGHGTDEFLPERLSLLLTGVISKVG